VFADLGFTLMAVTDGVSTWVWCCY